MKKPERGRPAVAASFFGKIALPFAAPILLTLALMALVGELWPRAIAPGSGLKLTGFIAALVAAASGWLYAVRGESDQRVRTFAAVACLATGLMGWPVWSVGVLPSVNGLFLGEERVVRTALQRTEATPISKQRGHHHWAWLKAEDEGDRAFDGRYFISERLYGEWTSAPPASVEISVARGMLGAHVVTGIR